MHAVVFLIPVTLIALLSAWTWALCDSLREERNYLWLILLLFVPPVFIPLYVVNFVFMNDPVGEAMRRRKMEAEARRLEERVRESGILGDWERLAEIYYKLRRWEDCLRALKEVFDRDPETLRGQYQAAVSLMNLDKPEAALPHLEYIVEEQPDFQTWHVQVVLGRLYEMLGRYDEALAAYDRCLDRIRDPDAILDRARLLGALGRTDESIASLRAFIKEVESDPRNAPHSERERLPAAKRLLEEISNGNRK